MARVVEIRVHGVGGTPPEHLLGESSSEDVLRTAGDGQSAFYVRRRDIPSKNVEGYAWGELTSRALLQPLWVFLLPFTLVNVAAWMLPAQRDSKGPSWHLARFLILVLGFALTVGYALGFGAILIKHVFYRALFSWSLLAEHHELRLVLGGLATAVIGLTFLLIARLTQKGFENVAGPLLEEEPERETALSRAALRSPFEEKGGLADRTFWARAGGARLLLWAHFAAWILAVVVLVVTAWGNAGCQLAPGRAGCAGLNVFRFTKWFGWLGLFDAALLIVLLLVLTFGFKRPASFFVTKHFRIYGPCVAISTAIALAGAFFAGLSIVVEDALDAAVSASWYHTGIGPEYDLGFAFGVGTLTFVAALLGVLLWLFVAAYGVKRKLKRGDLPLNTADPADEPNGVPKRLLPSVANARSFARFIRHSDLILTLPAITFAPVALITLLDMSGLATLWTVTDADTGIYKWTTSFGRWFILVAVGALLAFLYQGYLKHSQRRTVGIVWDVLTFWPRRFHPLAVRPYAERAVPELQWRMCKLLEDPDTRVILSAHSQGTVLAYAALVQLAQHTKLAPRICFVTYGSPLTRLHSVFFPGYFYPEGFERLTGELCRAKIGDRLCGWRNFYRLTDYIGQEVRIGDQPAMYNELLDDPRPSEPPGRFPLSYFRAPDALGPAWIELHLHSHYNKDPALRRWNEALRVVLMRE